MRNISFAITTDQVRNKTKTVTRRIGWLSLKPGEKLSGVEKCQGLKKGEKVKRIYDIEVVGVSRESLYQITPEEITREGFPGMTVPDFIKMFCKSHKNCFAETVVTRIEFKYL
jgi:hypothetical protein